MAERLNLETATHIMSLLQIVKSVLTRDIEPSRSRSSATLAIYKDESSINLKSCSLQCRLTSLLATKKPSRQQGKTVEALGGLLG